MSPFLRRPWFLVLSAAALGASLYLLLQARRRPAPADSMEAKCRAMYQAARTAADTLAVDSYMFMSEHPRGMASCERYRSAR